ncbi:MAG: sugar transferase [Bacteroidota bacterium]|nr:sugar transferase [Bacteroidota bacterium]
MKLQDSITGFYYVGTKRANITKLVSIYKHGYASGKLKEAMSDLLDNEDILPEVICFESGYGFTAIKLWAGMLAQNERLSKIPLIIDAGRMSTLENYQFIRSNMVDEILRLDECDENSLKTKIRFLQKFKARTRELEKQQKQELITNVTKSAHDIFKRVVDLIVSFVLLIIFSPLFILIALVIRVESRGNIFYVSKRAGKGYRIFNFYKFRTMFPDADQHRLQYAHLNQYHYSGLTSFFKIDNDPRVTRVGKFLRNTSLDELPQLFNVLSGDMSLVGNRPLPLYEAENLTTDALARRFLAPAGMTGLWQVQKRGKSGMSGDDRMNLDLNYADKSNLILDMWIMAHTPQALMQKANA